MNTYKFLRLLKETYSIGEIIDALIDMDEIDDEDDELNDFLLAILVDVDQDTLVDLLKSTVETWHK